MKKKSGGSHPNSLIDPARTVPTAYPHSPCIQKKKGAVSKVPKKSYPPVELVVCTGPIRAACWLAD